VLGDPALFVRIPEAYALVRGTDDKRAAAEMTFGHARGLLGKSRHEAQVSSMLLEAQQAFREQGDIWYLAQATLDLGMLAMLALDGPKARRCFDKALGAARALRDQALEAMACNNLGEVARLLGDDAEAATHYSRSLQLYRDMGALTDMPRLVHNCGYLVLHTQDRVRARTTFIDSLTQFSAIGQQRGMAEAVAGLAAVDGDSGSLEAAKRAARLWATADAVHRAGGTQAWPVDQAERERYERAARNTAGTSVFDAAFAAGQALSLTDAIAEALNPSLPR
jgi:tetratricopeptide (TPR) repeat protein